MDVVCTMRHRQIVKRKLYITFAIVLAFWAAGVCVSQESGELRLEGKHIERLVLRRKDGLTQRFDHPGETIRLPVGEYRLQDVRLKGGYNYSSRGTSTYNWMTVTENEAVTFQVGAPLKQTVRIERQGPILALSYELTGAGGETYAATRSKQPTFTVFKGEKEVAAGKFEFG